MEPSPARSAWTSGPGRVPSPCPWPSRGRRSVPDLTVWATDVSDDALAVAGDNRDALADVDAGAAARVRFALDRGSTPFPTEILGRVDLVVSNPPYVAVSEYPGLDPSVRALGAEGGPGGGRRCRRCRGMAAIEAIIDGALRWLSPIGSGGDRDRPRPGAGGDRRRPPSRVRSGRRRARSERAGSGCWWPGGRRDVLRRRGRSRRRWRWRPGRWAGGSVVAIPTDTVYGLAVDPRRPGAVERLFALKERPREVPLPVLVGSPGPGGGGRRSPGRCGGASWPTGSGPGR